METLPERYPSTHHYRHEIASQGFESLIKNVISVPDDRELRLAKVRLLCAPNEYNYKRSLLKELGFSLLPLLRQQIIKIYISPVRICLPKDPGPMLESIIDVNLNSLTPGYKFNLRSESSGQNRLRYHPTSGKMVTLRN
ncbi:hypothetical protein PSTT_03713 [Puccinia striiformis]|uniref:Uncharacterized protein n=1 Tax=Puccinia striiformis TaxID=27350 RepID=A0A2S4VVJ8_9BASI|nr:hypothetical protein PSTT_03713 [Puccinia striiformis]